jgi:predicted acyl esterase
MFGRKWETSRRKYGVTAERDVKVIMSDRTEINVDILRPDTDGKFPAILAASAYELRPQTAPIKPEAFSLVNGYLEAGDPNFFVRRGYVHVVASVRGTGKSGGVYDFLGPKEVRDMYEVIEWIASQPWCSGKVGMFGVSYFARIQIAVAALNPPSLKCIFAPWAYTDYYRDTIYRGGILGYTFIWGVAKHFSNARFESETRKNFGDKKFMDAIGEVLQDPDVTDVSELVQVLKNPDEGTNPFMVDVLLNPLDGPFWEARRPKYENIKIPAYIGCCWGNYGLHLPGTFRSWENLCVPKKMVVGPPVYLDRPVYQPQFESLRWFDYWLKGIDTGIMDEAAVRLFVMGTAQWKEADDWPLRETKWTPFYLHEDGLLSEHEHLPNEASSSFEDSPVGRGALQFASPALVEDTEVIGPIVLNLHASTTDNDVLWLITLGERDELGNERVLTKGWLRGTHRQVDLARSKTYLPFHPHTEAQPLTPGEIYEFNIALVPTANLFQAGSQIVLKISCSDDKPKNVFETIAAGSLRRHSASRVTVYHNADYPSHLVLPITKGNIWGTYYSGGKL